MSHLSIKGGVSWYYQIKLWDSRLYMMACTLKIFITQKIHILLLMKLTNVRYLYKRIQFDMCVCIYWNKNQSNINQSGFMFFYYFEIDIWIINNVEKSRNHKKLSNTQNKRYSSYITLLCTISIRTKSERHWTSDETAKYKWNSTTMTENFKGPKRNKFSSTSKYQSIQCFNLLKY